MEESLCEGDRSKRRKVRKGTQSCWECKRRKVRCIFAAPTNTACDNCRRRGTLCISQELPDTGPVCSSNSSNEVEARLGRVEELVDRLVNRDIPEVRPTSVVVEQRKYTAACVSQVANRRAAGKHEDVTRELISTWPSQSDLELIYTLPVGLLVHLHRGLCTPFSTSIEQDPPPPPREMLLLPPPDSHPVLIARKLLVLGAFLQGVLPWAQDLGGLGASYYDIMARVVDKAIRLVTTNDDLICSVEGIECIMLEALYHNYAGNLHKAWMAMRRASTVAQVMALHRDVRSPSLKILTPETRAAFNPERISFRMTEMDRYLSLMLGLPQSSHESRFATPKALEGCHPVERIQRIHCAVAGRILQRNDADVNNLAITHEIDQLLRKAADEMPPKWWLFPGFVSNSNSNRDNTTTVLLHDTIRLMNQFEHYHLLIRLHLPYMLRPSSDDRRYDHSKLTAVNVSREILSRYVAFRVSNPGQFYCRGTDYLAFVATTVICLAHIDSHSSATEDTNTVFNFLAHSRPSDRGTMERTLEIIQDMAATGTDMIASKLARIISQLLTIEASAATGTVYSTSSCGGNAGDLECNSEVTNGGRALHVYIPYLGSINFEGRSGGALSVAPVTLAPVMDVENVLLDTDAFLSPQQSISMEFPGADEWDLQGVDVALFDSIFRGAPDVQEMA